MAEETALVQPGFLLSKSRGRGGDKGRSSESATPACNGKESAAHHRRGDRKTDEYGGEGSRESLAFRKPVKTIGGIVHVNGVGVIKKKVVGNLKAVGDWKIAEKGKQEHVDVDTKQSAEETSLNTNDMNLFKESCNLSKGKPTLLRLPSLVSSGRITDARRKSSPEKKGLVKSKSLNLRTNVIDAGFDGTLETPEKDIVVAKSMILSMRPSRSVNHVAAQRSLMHHLSGSRSKTDDDGQAGKKISTFKLDTKPAATFSACENVEKSSDTEKVSRVVRVLSSARRPKAEPKDVVEDVVKVAPEKKSLASTKVKMTSSKALLAPSSSVTQSTVRSRTSYPLTRVKKSPEETEQKLEAKDASQSGLPKRRTTMSAESTNRRSYLKKESHGTDARKPKSDKFLPVRPSIRVEKSSQGSSNKVIRETANRLIRTRNKSKVMALIGAFETVISIQKKSARVNISKAKKRISSSKTSR